MSDFIKKVSEIQKKLNAPKSQYNSFGKYYFRNCEDILMAVKPLLGDMILTVTDEITIIGDRYYVVATATLTDGNQQVSATAYAREAESKKGMDDAQVTGSTSSYARKYALNGLLAIDDNKDADHSADKEEDAIDVSKACNAIVNAPDIDTAKKFARAATNRVKTNEDKERIANAFAVWQTKEAA